jgi:DNA-binding MarR family transcriptional regulator
MTETADDVVIPALLRAARGAYGHAVRRRLAAAGYEDLPRHGSFVLGGMVNHGAPLRGLLRQLGIGRERAGDLVDTLVLRGYLERRPDPDDPRGVRHAVTERGAGAAGEIREAIQGIDRELESLLTPDELDGLRAGLVALTTIRERMEAA